jgi:protein NRD1
MSSPVAELETALQGMLALKAPGVSGSRITSITQLCLNNVQVRTNLMFFAYRRPI